TTTARFNDNPEMYGKGWAGSTASGVSTGKTWETNHLESTSRSEAESSSQVVIRMPCSFKSGYTESAKTFAWRVCSAWAEESSNSSWSTGFMPLAAGTANPDRKSVV